MPATAERGKAREGSSYRISADEYGLDTYFPDGRMDYDAGRMSIWIPYASGVRRDDGGDLLHIDGIDLQRHRKNPIVLLNHGEEVKFPIAMGCEYLSDVAGQADAHFDPSQYTVVLDPENKVARVNAFFYRGKGIPGADRKDEYDHALLCEQLYDMACKGLIRGGSIGYLIKRADPFPPFDEKGNPSGLDLIQVLQTEASLVWLPMNMDTVMKSLDGRCCGKALCEPLRKMIEPHRAGRKVRMTVGEKGSSPIPAIQKIGEELAASTDPAPMPGYGQIFIKENGSGEAWYVGGDGDEHGFSDLVRERLLSVSGIDEVTVEAEEFPPKNDGWMQVYPEEKDWVKALPGRAKTLRAKYKNVPEDDVTHGELAYDDVTGKQVRVIGTAPGGYIKIGTADMGREIGLRRPGQVHECDQWGRKKSFEAYRISTSAGGGEPKRIAEAETLEDLKRQLRSQYSGIQIRGGDSLYINGRPWGYVKEKSLSPPGTKELRQRYRRIKGLRRKVKSGRPSTAMVYVDQKAFADVQQAATDRGLTCEHLGTKAGMAKIKLTGDDARIDEVATVHGKRMTMGKSLDAKGKAQYPTADLATKVQAILSQRGRRCTTGDVLTWMTDHGVQPGEDPKMVADEYEGKSLKRVRGKAMTPEDDTENKEKVMDKPFPYKYPVQGCRDGWVYLDQNGRWWATLEGWEIGDFPSKSDAENAVRKEGQEEYGKSLSGRKSMPDEPVGEGEPDEKYSSQVLRRMHENANLLLEEYDELAGPLEHEEIGKAVKAKCEDLVEEIEKYEALHAKHHPEAKALDEGKTGEDELDEVDAETKDEDTDEGGDADEADSGEKDEPPPEEESYEGMETKRLRRQLSKALRTQHGKGADTASSSAEEIAAALKQNMGGQASSHAATMMNTTSGTTSEKWAMVLTILEGRKSLPNGNNKTLSPTRAKGKACGACGGKKAMGDEEAQMEGMDNQEEIEHPEQSKLLPHEVKNIQGAAAYAKELSSAEDMSDEHRQKSFHWHKALESIERAEDVVSVPGPEQEAQGKRLRTRGKGESLDQAEDEVGGSGGEEEREGKRLRGKGMEEKYQGRVIYQTSTGKWWIIWKDSDPDVAIEGPHADLAAAKREIDTVVRGGYKSFRSRGKNGDAEERIDAQDEAAEVGKRLRRMRGKDGGGEEQQMDRMDAAEEVQDTKSLHPHRKCAGDASRFFKSMCSVKNLSDDHRAQAAEVAKGLDEVAGNQDANAEVAAGDTPVPEATDGDMPVKALEVLVQRDKQLKALNHSLAKLNQLVGKA